MSGIYYTDGSGLGLSIAQNFAELQNGIFKISIAGDMFKAEVKLLLTTEAETTTPIQNEVPTEKTV